MKKAAFTIFEMTLVMIILGFLIAFLIRSIMNLGLDERQQAATVLKVMDEFTQVSLKTLDLENKNFPQGVYFLDAMGTWEYTSLNDSGGSMTESELLEKYSKYAKFKRLGLNFCEITDCQGLGFEDGQEIPAVRWFSDTYIGILKNNTDNSSDGTEGENVYIVDCPDYNMPDSAEPIHTQKGLKCWARLFVDTNGAKDPNELGKDIYIFGLNETGIAK